MKTTYKTIVIGHGNHASIEIPENNLKEIGGNKRAPVKVTINGYTYQSTATGVDGKCMVVFPTKDRKASGAKAGDEITVTLELDAGYREVDIPEKLQQALKSNNLEKIFHSLNYSTRKEYCRLIREAKSEDTQSRRLKKIVSSIVNY